MIHHVWSVVCSESIIDKDTNNISLHSVLEQINLVGPPPVAGQSIAVPAVFELVSLWERLPNDQPARGRYRILAMRPNGQLLAEVRGDVDLSEYIRSRSRSRVHGLQVFEGGRHEFQVLLSEGGQEWKEVATVPLQVLFTPPEASGGEA